MLFREIIVVHAQKSCETHKHDLSETYTVTGCWKWGGGAYNNTAWKRTADGELLKLGLVDW
jgi:hypothetical protein